MSLENNIDRLTYRNSTETSRFAWKTIILSIVFGSAFFVIVPLTSSKPVKIDSKLIIQKAPDQVKIKLPEKEIIYEKKKVDPIQEKTVQNKPAPPEVPAPKAAPVPIKPVIAKTDFKLNVNLKLNTKTDFKVEKIRLIDNTPKKPVEAKKAAPVKKLPSKDYNAVFSKSDVDSDATVISRVNPVYPRRALRRNISGSVIIDCVISKEGKIINPKVIRATPKGFFEESCLNILDKMKYKPAMLDGHPVAQRMELTFDFGIEK